MSPLLWDLDRIPWATLRASGGRRADQIPDALRILATTSDEEEAKAAYWRIDNVVVIQARVFEAAEYVVPFALQLLFASSVVVQCLALELLIQLTGGWTDPDEIARGNVDLVDHCRARAKEGLAIIYWLLGSHDARVRESSVELLDYIENDTERLKWVLGRLIREEPDPKVRELAARVIDGRGV